MSCNCTHKIILFSDNQCGKGEGKDKGDALVVMASGGGRNIIPDLSKLKYKDINDNDRDWGNKIQSALVEKGKWELYTQLNRNHGSQGCEREAKQKEIPSVHGMSEIVRIYACDIQE